MSNILYYWEDGNGMYNGLKLLLVIPVTIHLVYIISNYWWTQFKVHASYRYTKRPEDASHALILLKAKTGLTNDIQQLHFLKIHHYIYNNNHYKEITFENEKYQIILENNIPKLVKKFQEHKQRIPNVHNCAQGLSHKEYYTQLQNYGENRIYLQYPKYSKILGDELLSPYFAFQVFTSVLYGLDNFMTYALFQFSFLFLNEGATMFSKYNSLKQVCKLAPKPTKVNVLRDGKEETISSAMLVPGDIVILHADDYNNLDKEDEDDNVEAKPFQPNEQIMQLPIFKLIFTLKEIIFGKYQDSSIWKDMDRIERSSILPADFILLDGQVITDESILTGEQTSQIKEAIERLDEEQLQPANYLYGGTRLVQVQSGAAKLLVAKTALQTEQGGLIKTIAFNDARMNITTKDSVVFLAIMCIVALFSSGYAFKRGYENNVSALNTLCLETLMIFVSVIPPDLPTELAMCIGNSIKDMRQKKIFSSDPYKILNAGRIKYICFDKSGTLTQSGIKIIGIDDQISQITKYDIISSKQNAKQQEQLKNYIAQLKTQKYSENAKLILACCQSLSQVKGKVLGDVLEVSQFAFVEGKFKGKDSVSFGKNDAVIQRRFFFNSILKRMSVIARFNGKSYVLTKGSPEAVKDLLTGVVADYDQAVDSYNLLGYRVLSLAFRELTTEEIEGLEAGQDCEREAIERDLRFAGLLICETPLKADTVEAIKILTGAGHGVKVISGDHVINLAVCCRNAGIFNPRSSPIIIQDIEISGNDVQRLKWLTIDKPTEVKESGLDDFLAKNDAICVTNSNNVLRQLLDLHGPQAQKLFQAITGFGRTTPQQKQIIVDRLQNQDSETRVMFVGDGVNDLNALQAADIGVALVEMSSETSSDGKNAKNNKKAKQNVIIPYPSVMGPNNTPASLLDLAKEAQARAERKHTNYRTELQVLLAEQAKYKQYLKIQKAQRMQANSEIFGMWNDAFETEAERDGPELGEATIAAAFTVKGIPEDAEPNASNLSGVLDVIRQGRCALSSVQMSFKSTALRCLTSAYQLTALTLNGVRSSDSQMIFGAILSIFVMLYVNKCKQQKIISKKRPPRSIVGLYLVSSMFLQAFVHVAAVYIAQLIADAPQVTMKLNTKFTPTLVNTAVFYVTMVQEVAVVLVNYPGKPHMQSILEHKKLCIAIFAYCVSVVVLVTEQVPELNEKLGLVSLSQEMQIQILGVCFMDCLLAFLVEKASALLFS